MHAQAHSHKVFDYNHGPHLDKLLNKKKEKKEARHICWAERFVSFVSAYNLPFAITELISPHQLTCYTRFHMWWRWRWWRLWWGVWVATSNMFINSMWMFKFIHWTKWEARYPSTQFFFPVRHLFPLNECVKKCHTTRISCIFARFPL